MWGVYKAHFTHEPRAVIMKLGELKRKCPKAIPRYLQSHVVWSRTLWCSVKPYVTRSSTKCYFNGFLFVRSHSDYFQKPPFENSLKWHLVEGPFMYDFTLHLRVCDHIAWFWRCVGTAFKRPLDPFFWALTISWSRLLAHVWSDRWRIIWSQMNKRKAKRCQHVTRLKFGNH